MVRFDLLWVQTFEGSNRAVQEGMGPSWSSLEASERPQIVDIFCLLNQLVTGHLLGLPFLASAHSTFAYS